MDITFKPRKFYANELRLLKILRTQREKENPAKTKFHYFIFAGLLGGFFTYIATIIPDSFWTFLFGTLAVFSFSYIVFMPYELYKMRIKNKIFLQKLNAFIDKGTVATCLISTTRIAFAPECEDESDLYIIELNNDEVLHLWDIHHNLNKKFPCLDFEVYEEKFSELLSMQIYPLSKKIEPIRIDEKTRLNFMEKYGGSENLETEKINFDELLGKYRKCV